jgi:hypothetical protein
MEIGRNRHETGKLVPYEVSRSIRTYRLRRSRGHERHAPIEISEGLGTFVSLS